MIRTQGGVLLSHPEGIYRCIVPDCSLKVAKFHSVKNRAFDKRLNVCLISSRLTRPSSTEVALAWDYHLKSATNLMIFF